MLKRIIYFVFKCILILTLPFLLLVRGSVYLHDKYDYFPYASLMGGMLIATISIFVYLLFFYRFFSIKIDNGNRIKRIAITAFLIVGAYVLHALFFINAENTKSTQVKKEIVDLHPILRVAVSTIIILDKDLIITDASRTPEDYRRMGMRNNSTSLHFPQKDGYAYAIDLRTNSRTEVRNNLLRLYFKAMGFNTLRHGGTADHLHVSISCPYRPGKY